MTFTDILPEGMPGEPLPYLLRTDGMITIILFLCFILVSSVFSRNQKHIQQELKNFIQNRERKSMFDEVNATDARHTLLLLFHTCVMLGLCTYYYYTGVSPTLFTEVSHSLLLGSFVTTIALFITCKWIVYNFINWIFFQKARNILWMTSFVNLHIWLGILLLPVLLITVYFDISSRTALFLIGILLVFAKILLFWKCFSNFFEKFYGAFHLILYFCALEILRDLILWNGMEVISNILTLKL